MSRKLLRDVRPDIFSMVKDKEKYANITFRSSQIITFICPRCGHDVEQMVCNVEKRGLSCKRCGDGMSFGEKFIFNLLDQLEISFDTHISFSWSCNRVYDVCIHDDKTNTNILMEIHGAQHYQRGFASIGGRTLEEEISNDVYKKQLAIENGFSEHTYIVVDCRESTLQYIKDSVYNNVFFKKYDLDSVDWDLCVTNATSSYAIRAQQLWESGYKMCDICSELKLCSVTVAKYLKNGANNGLCSYTPEEAHRRSWSKGGSTSKKMNTSTTKKKISILCPELCLSFQSIAETSRYTGVSQTHINYIVSGKRKWAKKTKYGFPLTFIKAS